MKGICTMNITLGKKISDYRKALGLTQDQLAEKMNVSPQAVSKWENDISCPDISLLPKLAALFGITVDELLSVETKKEIELLPEDKKKNFDDLILRVVVNSSDGDKVRVNLPMPLVKLGLEMGMSFSQVSDNNALKNIDVGQILRLVKRA
jgi:transcriptional regulator with XRE-family HTH domain